jgi:hypothetical protein
MEFVEGGGKGTRPAAMVGFEKKGSFHSARLRRAPKSKEERDSIPVGASGWAGSCSTFTAWAALR